MKFKIKSILIKVILFFIALIGLSCNVNEQINLKGNWKFNTGDDLQWKEKTYDDSRWINVEVPKYLEQQGFKNYRGTAWYRKLVIISTDEKEKLLAIYFSNIADSDEVYFNGELIGNSGSLIKNGAITPHLSRIYTVPSKLIEYGSENLVAVRFLKQFGPFVGIFNKSPVISEAAKLNNLSLFDNYMKSYCVLISAIIVFLLGCYHLILYFHLRVRKDYLVFSAACFTISIYETFLSFIPYFAFNNLNLIAKLHFISCIVCSIFVFWFILCYFDYKRFYLVPIYFIITMIYCIIIFSLNNSDTNLAIFNTYIALLLSVFFIMLYVSIKNVMFSKTRGNYFIPLGILAVIISTFNDGFVTAGYYYANFFIGYGFLFFVIGISISLANDYTNAFRAEQLKSKTLDNIQKTTSGLTAERNLGKLIENSMEILKRHLSVARCTIVLADKDGEFNSKAKVFGHELREPLSEIEDTMPAGGSGQYIIKDVEDTFSGGQKGIGKKYRQMLIAPMLQVNKRIGLMILSKKNGGKDFTKDDREFVSIIAPQLALAVENAAAFDESQQEIKRQRDALIMSEKMAAIGQLTSGIGHEINNPINFIISYVPPVRENVEVLIEVLKLYEQLNSLSDHSNQEIAAPPARNDMPLSREEIIRKIEEIKKREKLENKLPRILRSLDAISDGANRVASIVDSLKAYARADTLPAEIDINDAIDKSLIILTNKLKNRIEVKKEYDKNVRATCYYSINQVIVNLLSNAAEAIIEKGEISIKTQTLRDKIRFFIKDSGIGMTEEIKKKLFTPFFTTKTPGKGTGLGLSISYNIIYDQHNGTIGVDSTPGKGSTFTVTIPREIQTRS